MDFLDNLVLQQSAHHMVLLKYLLVLTFVLFFSYAGILFGSTSLSLFFKLRFNKTSNDVNFEISKKFINLITFNKSVGFALGLVPLLSAAFCYAQLLHKSRLDVPEFILISAAIFYFGLAFIYLYKFKLLKEKVSLPFGIVGFALLLFSIYLFIGSVQLAADTENWKANNSLLGVVISLKTPISFLQFLAVSFSLTSVFSLFKYFRKNSEAVIYDDSTKTLLKDFSLKFGLVSTLIIPLLIVVNVFIKPINTFSFDFFGYAVIVLLILLLISNLFYLMIKKSNVNLSSGVLFLFVVAISLLVIKDQYAFDTSTKKHFVVLAADYDEYQKKVQEEFGLLVETINGADIFNGKCIACHQFDKKLVGPPYNSVLPKYEGKRDQLIQYVLNPVKINPDYPAMPNQGLKPKEAEAIADYLMTTYKK